MDRLGCLEDNSKIKLGEWITAEPVHCHQRLLENTLVSKVRFTSEDKVSAEISFKFIPQELPFFFDHDIDHLPGMLEINAMRQATLAMAHLLYDVPLDFVALLDWMDIRLFNYGELNIPTTAKSKLLGSSRSRHKITLTLDGLMVQGAVPIMRATGKLVMLSCALARKTRHKKLTQEQIARKDTWINL